MMKRIIEFKNSREWLEFEKYYSSPSVMKQLDMFRYEDANTNFLHSLLQEDNIYNLGSYPLKLLIELIKCKDSSRFPDINILDFNLKNIQVKKQVPLLLGKKIKKPDLIITFTIADKEYLMVLEAKLFSEEWEDQCRDYVKAIESTTEYKNKEIVYIFLSLNPNAKISDEKNYIKITYQDLIDYVYTPCSIKTQNQNISLSIEEYMKGFVSIYEYEDIDFSSIPITDVGKKLTLEIWEKYPITLFLESDVFNDFCKANEFVSNALLINILKLHKELNLDDNTRNVIKQRLINTTNKYCLDRESKPCGKAELVYKVFKRLIKNNGYQKYSDIPPEILYSMGDGWNVVVLETEIQNNPHISSYRLKKNGEEPLQLKEDGNLCYIHNIGKPDIDNFVNAVIKCYPKYKDLITVAKIETKKKRKPKK